MDRVSMILGCLDRPADGQTLEAGPVVLEGWAIGGTIPVSRVEIWIDDSFVDVACLGRLRPDVAAHLARPDAAISGFEFCTELAASQDSVTLRARAVLVDGTVGDIGTHTVRVVQADGHDHDPAPVAVAARDHGHSSRAARGPAGPLRLLCIARDLDVGGSQLRMRELLVHLSTDLRYPIHLVSPGDGPLRRELEEAGISIDIRPAAPLDSPSRYDAWITEAARAWEGRYELVYGATLSASAAIEAARFAGIPAIWRIGERESLRTVGGWLQQTVHPEVERRFIATFPRASAVVFNARETLDAHVARGARGNLLALPSGTDVAAARKLRDTLDRKAARAAIGVDAETFLVLQPGSFWPVKGQHLLIGALAGLAARHPNVRVLQLGHADDLPYADGLRAAAAQLGLTDRVEIRPFDADLSRWMRAADAVVVPSESESLPAVLLEAMAHAVPTVGADVGGIPEVLVDGITGWVCSPNDVSSLTAALDRMLTMPAAERHSIAARGAELVGKHYDSAQARVRLVRLFESVVGTTRVAGR
jgi:glycosyltransferase involved in cell wall biosynthesis